MLPSLTVPHTRKPTDSIPIARDLITFSSSNSPFSSLCIRIFSFYRYIYADIHTHTYWQRKYTPNENIKKIASIQSVPTFNVVAIIVSCMCNRLVTRSLLRCCALLSVCTVFFFIFNFLLFLIFRFNIYKYECIFISPFNVCVCVCEILMAIFKSCVTWMIFTCAEKNSGEKERAKKKK